MYDDSIILRFGDIYVAEEVLNYFFTCDLAKCKGACCTKANTAGALLSEAENERYRLSVEKFKPFVTSKVFEQIANKGVSERKDVRFFMATQTDTSACVFVEEQNGVATCLIQTHEAEIGFRKPHSCSLFPIRETRSIDGRPLLYLEEWDECEPGFDLGEELEVPLYVFMRNALVARFGETFYEAIHEFVESGQLSELYEQDLM